MSKASSFCLAKIDECIGKLTTCWDLTPYEDSTLGEILGVQNGGADLCIANEHRLFIIQTLLKIVCESYRLDNGLRAIYFKF